MHSIIVPSVLFTASSSSMAAQEDPKRPLRVVAGSDDFGRTLKDALVSHLRSLNIEVEDLGTDKYYNVGSEVGRRVSAANSTSNSATETRGLVACGTGVGVSIFANKFPGVYSTTCVSVDEAKNNRSINNCNILAVGGMGTDPETGVKILETWLNTPFKSPCPASDNNPWPEEIDAFLTGSVNEMSKIGSELENSEEASCAICELAKDREFVPIDIMPGGSMKIVRQSPTSAIVRFKAGSVEPAHHHTFGHDLVVLKGSKKVWNLSKKEGYELGVGDFLFTPAGDVHRVKYFEDSEFFIRWDGHWDIFLDEDLDAARDAIAKE